MFCTGLVAGWSNCYVGVIALDVDMIFLLIFGLCVAVVHLNSFYQCYINHLLACLTFILTFCPYLFASLLTCIPLCESAHSISMMGGGKRRLQVTSVFVLVS